MKNWQKKFVIRHVAHEFYLIYAFFANIEKLSISLESTFSYLFRKMSQMQNLSREMVMENKKNNHKKVIGKKMCKVYRNPVSPPLVRGKAADAELVPFLPTLRNLASV